MAGLVNGDFASQTYTIDNSSPKVLAINCHDASPTKATSVQFDVTFSKSVTSVSTSEGFALPEGADRGHGPTVEAISLLPILRNLFPSFVTSVTAGARPYSFSLRTPDSVESR